MKKVPLSERGIKIAACYDSQAGITLIELLTVMTIVIVMAGLTLPAFDLVKSSRLNLAVEQLEANIREASNHAVSRRVYVWMGLRQEQDGVLVVLVSSGQARSLDPADVRLLSRPVFLKDTRLLRSSDLPDVSGQAGDELQEGDWGSIDLSLPGAGPKEFDQLVLFTPQGEASLSEDHLPRWISIAIGLGNARIENSTLIQINGLTSKCVTFRP